MGLPPGRLSAPTAQAKQPGTGYMNWSNLLNLIARGLFDVGATWCISTEKPLEGGTTV